VNYLQGNEGNDLLTGGDGEGTMLGGFGDDLLSGDAGYNTVVGEEGNDLVIGGSESDSLCGDQLRGRRTQCAELPSGFPRSHLKNPRHNLAQRNHHNPVYHAKT